MAVLIDMFKVAYHLFHLRQVGEGSRIAVYDVFELHQLPLVDHAQEDGGSCARVWLRGFFIEEF